MSVAKQKFIRVLVFGALSLVAITKLLTTLTGYLVRETGIDGGYYVDLAQNIARLGLIRTDVSPFFQGIPSFPAPTSAYPLWPMLMSVFGEDGIWAAGFFMPTVLWILTLFVFYRLAKELNLFSPIRWNGFVLNSGHLLAFFFLIQYDFFSSTSRPYTEGLAFFLLALNFLVLKKCADNPRYPIRYGVMVGVLGALLLLTRSQMILFVGCVGIFTFLLWSKYTFGIFAKFTTAMTVVMVALLLPQYRFLQTFTDHPFHDYMFFDQYKATNLLPAIATGFKTVGIFGYVRDRLDGVVVAMFGNGYYSNLHFLHLAFLLLPVVGVQAWLRRRRPTSIKESCKSLVMLCREQPFLTTFVIFALLCLMATHHVHLQYWQKWYFQARHSIWVVFAVFFCWVYLIRLKNQAINRFLIFLLVISSVKFIDNISPIRKMQQIFSTRSYFVEDIARQIEFLTKRNVPDVQPRRVLLTEADLGKRLAPFLPNFGFQENFLTHDVDTLRMLLHGFNIDYVLYKESILNEFREKYPEDFEKYFSLAPPTVINEYLFYKLPASAMIN